MYTTWYLHVNQVSVTEIDQNISVYVALAP